MIQAVFSDVDGTLLNSENRISPLTERAIKSLKQSIPFVIVSARSPSGIYPILNRYGLKCPIISYSGGYVLDADGKVLYNKGFSKTDARSIINFIENRGFDLTYSVYAEDEWVVKSRADARIAREERIVETSATEKEVEDISADSVNKILCCCNPNCTIEIENELKANFPAFTIVKSSAILIEIMARDVNKANAVEVFCKIKGIDIAKTAAFGDNYNDVEMLQKAGHGFIMGNAPADLLRQFPNKTEDNDNDGIYHALRRLGLVCDA